MFANFEAVIVGHLPVVEGHDTGPAPGYLQIFKTALTRSGCGGIPRYPRVNVVGQPSIRPLQNYYHQMSISAWQYTISIPISLERRNW